MAPPWPGPAPHQQEGRPDIPLDANLNDPAVGQYRDFLDWFDLWREWWMETPQYDTFGDVLGAPLLGDPPGVERERDSVYSRLPDEVRLPITDASLQRWAPHRFDERASYPPTDVVPWETETYEDASTYAFPPGSLRDPEQDVLSGAAPIQVPPPAAPIPEIMQYATTPAPAPIGAEFTGEIGFTSGVDPAVLAHEEEERKRRSMLPMPGAPGLLEY